MKVTRNIDTGDEKQTIRTISTKPKEHFEGRWKSGRLYPLYSVVVNNGTTFISQNAKMKEEPYVIYDADKKEFKAPDGWLIKEMSADSRVTALGGGGEGGVTPEEVEEMIKDKVDKVDGKGLSTNDYDNTEKNKVASAYQKPNNGIPKSDLAKAVQDVLDDADGAYKKPVTGIPFADLADGVQDSLSNADEAKAGLADKQNTISDLLEIRAGAAAGASAAVRPYNSQSPNGMGYLVLEKDKTFAEQVTDTNTIYEIRYDFSVSTDVTIPANCELRFNGGSITGSGKISGTNTLINSDSECFGKDVVFAGSWANETIFTKWFAFVSSDDGVTDNSICFKQLQAVINGTNGCKVEFEEGMYQTQIIGMEPEEYVDVDNVTYPKWAMNTYQVDKRVVLNIFELPYLEINLNGATIKAINITCPGWNMIRLNGVEKCSIHDGTLVGMANGFNYPDYVNYTGTVKNNYEFSSLLIQGGGFCEVSNLICKYATGDGMMMGSNTWYFPAGTVRRSGIVAENTVVNFPANGYAVTGCEVLYCGRNGITLHSSHAGKLENCHIHHIGSDAGNGVIGTDGIKGQNPRSGIDVEFEDGQGLKPIMQWDSLYIHDCGAKSFVFDASGIMKQFNATNCRFIGLGVTNVMSADGTMEFANCYFEHSATSEQGTLYGKDIVFRDCQIILKRKGLMIGANTFINCTITDEISGTLSTTDYVFIQDSRKDAIFRNCKISILSGHPYGYMQNWKLYGCTLNFYNNGVINSCGIECYDCNFHNDPDDTSGKSFRFGIGNNPNLTRGHFWFTNCSFEKLVGTQGGSSDYAFNSGENPVVIDGCSFKSILFYHGTYIKDIQFKNCNIDYIFIMSYQDSASGVKALRFDNCVISNYNSGSSRTIPIEITGSKVRVVSGGNYKLQTVNFTKCEISNEVTRGAYADAGVNAVDSIFDFVASTATGAFSLVNCYVKGLVTEASFTGTKQNCTFATPFAKSGATANRPTASTVGAGFTYFDTDLGKMIVSNGTAWVNMDGTALA